MPVDRTPFSLLDLLAAAAGLLSSVVLALLPFVVAPGIAALYADFEATLPLATRVALAPWPSPMLGLLLAALVVAAVVRRDPVHRRWMLASGALGGALAIGALWYALYLPLFELSDSIR
jgi:type II secretory pathway component PulF